VHDGQIEETAVLFSVNLLVNKYRINAKNGQTRCTCGVRIPYNIAQVYFVLQRLVRTENRTSCSRHSPVRGLWKHTTSNQLKPVPVAARSKAKFCGPSPAEIAGSYPDGAIDVCCDCCVLSRTGLCDKLIIRPEESYRLWCVVCDLETS
jgi:hypothetical protein